MRDFIFQLSNKKQSALLSILCLVLFTGCSAKEEVEKAEVIRPAKLIKIASTDNIKQLSFPALIEASGSSQLTFQVSGLLKTLDVKEGQEVKKGAIIARLDQRKFTNELTSAKSQFDSAEQEFLRAERLLAQDAIARTVFQQRQSQRDVARAQLDSVRKSLEDTVLRSPFAGVVSVVHTENFQNVQALEPIITLQTTGAAEAVVQIPASLVANSGRIEPIETMVELDAAPGVRMPAEFLSSTGQADQSTQTFQVKFAFTPKDKLVILPGMTGSVKSKLSISNADGSKTQVRVPVAAVMAEADTRFVWIVDTNEMTVSKRTVTVEGIGESLVVNSGLKAGDTIVGAGASYLHDGMKIRAYEQ